MEEVMATERRMEPRSTKRQRMDDLIEKSMGLARHQYASGGGGGGAVTTASRNTHTNEELRGGMTTMPARKGTWTKEEDARLRALIEQHGRKWAVIAQSFPNRDRKRCRERYINHLDPVLTRRQWTTEEDKTLEQLNGELGSQWSRIAKQLTGRSPDDVKNRCFQLRPQQQTQDDGTESTTHRRTSHAWTHAEAEKLRAVVDVHGAKDWFFIASQLPGRTDLQCRQHWFRVLQPSITKGRGSWTPEEDMILLERVESIGAKWTEIAQDLPGRLGKQCRDRYVNYVDPSIRTDPWTPGEDAILKKAQVDNPNKWAVIATLLPGRPENAIKNHWNAMQRRNHTPKVTMEPQVATRTPPGSSAADPS